MFKLSHGGFIEDGNGFGDNQDNNDDYQDPKDPGPINQNEQEEVNVDDGVNQEETENQQTMTRYGRAINKTKVSR